MPDNISRPRSQLFYSSRYGDTGILQDDSYQYAWVDARSGVKNPKWRQQIAARQNATTVLTGNKVRANWKPGYARWTNPSFGPNWWLEQHGSVISSLGGYQAYVVPDAFPTSLLSEANSIALTRFINTCVNAQRSFEGLTFFGELRETLRMIKNPARALRRGISQYHREAKRFLKGRAKHNPLGAASDITSKGLSGLWLEKVFGWAPLISDIQSGMEALNRYDPNPTIDVRSGAREKSSVFQDITTNNFGNYTDFKKHVSYQASVRYKGEIWATAPYLKDFGPVSRWGFDPVRDFLPTVYELIPYSFLVDYFTNIGTIIQAASFWKGNLSWYCRTYELLTISRLNGLNCYRLSPNFQLQSAQPEQHTYINREVRRDLPPTLIPDVTFKLPGSGLKWLNIAALANERR